MAVYVQIGVAVLRDTTTGEPLKPTIPLFAKSKTEPQASGYTRGEEKLLTDVAGVYVDIFQNICPLRGCADCRNFGAQNGDAAREN